MAQNPARAHRGGGPWRYEAAMRRGLAILATAVGAAWLAPAAVRAEGTPLDSVLEMGAGEASYFGAEMAGRRTASGETCDPETMTAAHRTLPLGSWLRVTDAASGASVVVRVNDRGPYARGRVLDVSRAAARKLGMLSRGRAQVRLRLAGEDER